jgi:RNA polymerase sigma-70 factor, ECF subfamily
VTGQSFALDEGLLIQRAREGDEAAFAAIYDHYERPIYNYVYKIMLSADDAADITQDCFVKAYVALPKTNEELNLQAWLYRIASNACLDVLRRRKRVRWMSWDIFDDGTLPEPSANENDGPELTYSQQETRETVIMVLKKMSPKYRTCLVLREYEGFSCAEIAKIMGSSRSAIKSMLFRGREQFRQVYQSLEANGQL